MDKVDALMIVAFARCNMNIHDAAERVYYHGNSLRSRFVKIKRATGLDPRNFFDLIELYSMAREILGDKFDNI